MLNHNCYYINFSHFLPCVSIGEYILYGTTYLGCIALASPSFTPLLSASKCSSSSWNWGKTNSWKFGFLVVVVQPAPFWTFLLHFQHRSHNSHCRLSVQEILVTMMAWGENCPEFRRYVLCTPILYSNIVKMSPSADLHDRYNMWLTKCLFCLEMKLLVVCLDLSVTCLQTPSALGWNARCPSCISLSSGML